MGAISSQTRITLINKYKFDKPKSNVVQIKTINTLFNICSFLQSVNHKYSLVAITKACQFSCLQDILRNLLDISLKACHLDKPAKFLFLIILDNSNNIIQTNAYDWFAGKKKNNPSLGGDTESGEACCCQRNLYFHKPPKDCSTLTIKKQVQFYKQLQERKNRLNKAL